MRFIAVEIAARPPNARRITGPLARLFSARGKLLVTYVDGVDLYVRWGRNQWARVEEWKGDSPQ